MEDTYGIQSRIGSIIVVERWYCCRGSPVFSDRDIQMNAGGGKTFEQGCEVKAAAEQLFNELGLNPTTAVNIFLRQAIRTGGIPFEIKVNTPNEITASAIAEGRRIMRDKNTKGCHNMDELKAALKE